MNTNQLLAQLSYGEFNNLALSNEGDGTIRTRDMGKMLTFINDGLHDLYTKFLVKESVVTIQLYEYITNYLLVPRFAQSNQVQTDVSEAYILDNLRDKFKGDVGKIYAVFNDLGVELPINDETKMNSVFIRGKESITVPSPDPERVLFIHYQTTHPRITMQNLDEELDIHDTMIAALRSYVAHKLFLSIGSADAIHKAQEYQGQYIFQTQSLVAIDASGDSRFHFKQFKKGGWV